MHFVSPGDYLPYSVSLDVPNGYRIEFYTVTVGSIADRAGAPARMLPYAAKGVDTGVAEVSDTVTEGPPVFVPVGRRHLTFHSHDLTVYLSFGGVPLARSPGPGEAHSFTTSQFPEVSSTWMTFHFPDIASFFTSCYFYPPFATGGPGPADDAVVAKRVRAKTYMVDRAAERPLRVEGRAVRGPLSEAPFGASSKSFSAHSDTS